MTTFAELLLADEDAWALVAFGAAFSVITFFALVFGTGDCGGDGDVESER